MSYTVRRLDASSWDMFAELGGGLVEAISETAADRQAVTIPVQRDVVRRDLGTVRPFGQCCRAGVRWRTT